MQVIGYQITAFIGKTNVLEVCQWLKYGLRKHLEERMKAVFDVASPIEDVEFELVAQAFLWGILDAMPTPLRPPWLLPRAEGPLCPAVPVAKISAVRPSNSRTPSTPPFFGGFR